MTNRRQDLFVRLATHGLGAILHTIPDTTASLAIALLLAEHARNVAVYILGLGRIAGSR